MALWFMRCVRGLLRGRSIVEIAADAGRARTSMNDRRHNALRMPASERALHHEGAIVRKVFHAGVRSAERLHH